MPDAPSCDCKGTGEVSVKQRSMWRVVPCDCQPPDEDDGPDYGYPRGTPQPTEPSAWEALMAEDFARDPILPALEPERRGPMDDEDEAGR